MSARAVGSYLSIARRIERDLEINLSHDELNNQRIDNLLLELRNRGHTAKHVSSCGSVLRAYADFKFRRNFPVRASIQNLSDDNGIPFAEKDPLSGGDLASYSVADLFSQYAAILRQLRLRNIIRTENSPVGDYGEYLFREAFGWKLAGNSEAGHDAQCSAGIRYQIKTRRLAAPSASRQLGALRKLDQRNFDFLAAVLLAPDFSVLKAVLIPYDVVLAHSIYGAHTNSWRLILDDRLIGTQGVRDVTESVTSAAISG